MCLSPRLTVSVPKPRAGFRLASGSLVTSDTPTDLARDRGKEFPALIASMPITSPQRRAALGVIIFVAAVFALLIPFAHIQLARVDAFIPVVQTVLCFADLITAVFLFSQYSIQPQRALLALASGYICSGLFAFLQTLQFPGAYSATGLLSDDPNCAGWLFSFWHISFPLAVIAYVLLKDRPAGFPHTFEPGRAIAITVACVLVVITGLTWIATAGLLPTVFVNLRQISPFYQYLNGAMWLLNAIALVLVFIRMRTILGLWLAVVLFASLPDLSLPLLYPVIRYSFGWYVGRIYTLIASCTVLAVLLIETTMLYARLANALVLQRRERAHRIMSMDEATSAIAHEIRQPLSSISFNCGAALNFLKSASPDLEQVRATLTNAISSSIRVSEIVESVRGLFKITVHHPWGEIEINSVAREVLQMAESDLLGRGISVSMELQEGLPKIVADPVQLQLVMLNLVKNAIEATDSVSQRAESSSGDNDSSQDSTVSLFVQDTGSGISPENQTRIFEPFFTTKHSGMGLGLSICRRIIEDHGGDLRLTASDSHGSTFEIEIPAART
jgi:signal transduction histidine kinase